jgi:hypothetical protein
MKQYKILVLAVVALLVVPASAMAITEGEPSLSADLSNNRVTAGEVTALEVTVQNKGKIERSNNPSLNSQVTTANGVQVSLSKGDAPLTVKTDTQAIGTLPQTARTIPFRVVVDEDPEPGRYKLDGQIRHWYTSLIDPASGAAQEEDAVRRFTLTLVVKEEPRFEIIETESGIAMGDDGPITVTLRNNGTNAGEEAVSDVSAKLFIDSPVSVSDDEAFIDELGLGVTRMITFGVSMAGSATAKVYPVELDFQYTTAEGDTLVSDSYNLPVEATPLQGGNGLPLPLIGGLVLVVLLGVGGFIYTRR